MGKQIRVARQGWDIGLGAGREPVADRPGTIRVDPGLAYDPGLDVLVVEVQPGVQLRIAAGRRFGTALARLMTRVGEEAEAVAERPSDVLACVVCGARIVHADLAGERHGVYLDARPSPHGIYVSTGERAVRMLRPLEEPTGPTYAAHACKEKP